jgi:2-methylcitrate dehydratase PrpD
MDALRELKARHGLAARDVAEIVVRAPRSHLANLAYPDPQTVAEARFSLEFPLAMLLLEGECGLSRFTEEQVGRADVRALYGRIRREPTDDPLAAVPTQVEVVLNDGRRVSEVRAMAVGSIAAPFTEAQYWEKFDGCVAGVLPDERASRLRAALEKLPMLQSLRELTEPLLA